jgi:hypothetical protein
MKKEKAIAKTEHGICRKAHPIADQTCAGLLAKTGIKAGLCGDREPGAVVHGGGPPDY